MSKVVECKCGQMRWALARLEKEGRGKDKKVVEVYMCIVCHMEVKV